MSWARVRPHGTMHKQHQLMHVECVGALSHTQHMQGAVMWRLHLDLLDPRALVNMNVTCKHFSIFVVGQH